MTTDRGVTNDGATRARSANRRDLFLIIGMLVLVVAASTALYTATQKGVIDLPSLLGTKNKGELVTPPLAIADLSLRDADGHPFDYAAESKRWTLLVPAIGGCEDACEQALYLSRQVDIALGRDANRARRYLVTTDWPLSPTLQQQLRDQHADIKVLRADPMELQRYLDQVDVGDEPPRLYVVDPYGWLMMYYSAQHEGHAVLDDLKFLIKNAHENEELE